MVNIGILGVILGQIQLEGFDKAAELNTIFAILVSVIIVLFAVVVIMFKGHEDKNSLLQKKTESHLNEVIEIKNKHIDSTNNIHKEYQKRIDDVRREYLDKLDKINIENTKKCEEIRNDFTKKLDEIRRENTIKEDARNKKWDESEKETLNVLNGVNKVLEMSEKMKEHDTKAIMGLLDSIKSKLDEIKNNE